MSLEQAQKLLLYPIDLGKHKNKKIELKSGPHGLYATYNSKNYNLSSLEDSKINLEEVIKIISQQESNVLQKFNEHISILKGPYGNYISTVDNGKKKNIPLGKSLDPKKITLDEIKKIISEYAPKRKWTAKKK